MKDKAVVLIKAIMIRSVHYLVAHTQRNNLALISIVLIESEADVVACSNLYIWAPVLSFPPSS
jgi:hypothetical protein